VKIVESRLERVSDDSIASASRHRPARLHGGVGASHRRPLLPDEVAFGKLQETHYFFTFERALLNNVPDGSLDSAGMERALREPRKCRGTYKVAGSSSS
jgi:hypothetical protein